MSTAVMTDLFDYAAQPKEDVAECNLCGWKSFVAVNHPDRYGFPVTTQVCRGCGLAFLSPRMTRAGYADFYSGAYRALVSAFHGRPINAETIQPEQLAYARALAAFLEPYVGGRVRTILDVGGSTGVVARVLADRLEARATVLDPCVEELGQAVAMGLTGVVGTVEGFDPAGQRWDLVTMCQTADHVLDLAGALRKLRGCVSPEGWLWVDIVDFGRTREVKVDHPYNLTEWTMRRYLRAAGLPVVALRLPKGADVHVGFLCRRGK